MRRRFDTHRDDPATRELRLAVLGRSKILGAVGPERLASLLRHSCVATCASGTVLFTAGDTASQVFVIGTGVVQLHIGLGLEDWAPPIEGRDGKDAMASGLHLQLLSAQDTVAGLEMAALAAGHATPVPRGLTAAVIGEPAQIVAIEQAPLARLLDQDPSARLRVAELVIDRFRRVQRLMEEVSKFKQKGKVRLARYLLELFDAAGQVGGGGLELPFVLSQDQIAAALGLTRRSVLDDVKSLEDFGAIDHDRLGRLMLLDRTRLGRIAATDASEDREDNANSWMRDVDAALDDGDTLRARELGREALSSHPRHPGLRYRAALAALRSGAWEEASDLIQRFGFSAEDPSEDIAALTARVLKNRALAARAERERQRLAMASAQAYRAIHSRTAGPYSGINASSMLCLAGEVAEGRQMAEVQLQFLGQGRRGYWQLASKAEALALLGRYEEAAMALNEAVRAPDADDGKIATTCRQLRYLARHFDPALGSVLKLVDIAPVLVVAGDASDVPKAVKAPERAMVARRVLCAVSSSDDLFSLEKRSLEGCDLTLVLAAPGENLLARGTIAGPRKDFAASLLLRHRSHVVDPTPGPVSPQRRRLAWRQALGLGTLSAAAYEAPLILAGSLDAADTLAVAPAGETLSHRPAWATDELPDPEVAPLLWIESLDDGQGSDGMFAALEEAEFPGAKLFRFASMSAALKIAVEIRDRARRHGQGTRIRICLALERIRASGIGSALISRLRPATAPNEICATESAAAELALLQSMTAELRPVGRVRSDKRFSRIPIWLVDAL
jgi:CRP-like cAMP-binding protein